MFRKRRFDVVAGAAGAMLGLVLALVVAATAAHASRAAESVGPAEVNVLTITSQERGQVLWNSRVFVRVNCTNNFDGDPTNNTVPGPTNYPSDPNPVDGYVYLSFGFETDRSQSVSDAEGADASDSCIVEQTQSRNALEVVYAATSDDPDTIVETQQPPPGLGFAKVTWPTGAVDPAGDSARVTITTQNTPCPTGTPFCSISEEAPWNQIRIKNQIRGDAPDPPNITVRLRCWGGGVMDEQFLTFTDQTAQSRLTPPARNRCVLKEIDTGGADRVEYFARSRTGADASFGANSARVDFADSTGFGGGGHAVLRVTNRYDGTCPATPPGYC